MIWLQAKECYNCIAQFDPQNNVFIKKSRDEIEPNTNDGSFEEMNEGIFMLYRFNGKIYFQVNDKIFLLDENTVIDVAGERPTKILKVLKNEMIEYETKYTPTSFPIEGDLTPFIDEEDFDFGLFVSNISKNPKRKEVLLGIS
jgi:hypothetical protein